MGTAVDPKTGNPLGSVPTVLQFNNNFVPAQATTAIQYAANLPTVPVTAASPNAPTGLDHRQPAVSTGRLRRQQSGRNRNTGAALVNASVVGNAALDGGGSCDYQ